MKLIVISTITLGLLFSCDSEKPTENSETNSEKEIWVIKKAEGMLAESNVGTEYIFEGNKMTLNGSGLKNEGIFEMKNDTLVFHMKTYTGEMSYIKKIKGKQMILAPIGSDQVFYLEKNN